MPIIHNALVMTTDPMRTHTSGVGMKARPLKAMFMLGMTLLLAACGSPGLAPQVPTPTAPAVEITPTSGLPAVETEVVGDKPCENGRMHVGDLPKIDAVWKQGVQAATAAAIAWQPDAILTTFKVVCQLFEPGFRWQATFYSRNAQAFFQSDTGDVEPAGIDPALVSELDISGLSFGMLHRSVAKSGYTDDAIISTSTGVDVRMNTEGQPFGPPGVPQGIVLYHLAVERLGETRDLFVSGADGTVYLYPSEA